MTAGVISNQYQLDLVATGAGGSLTVGNTTCTITFIITSADPYKMQVKFPSSTPYLGFGWGHGMDTGLRFSFDVRSKLGKALVGYQLSGPLADLHEGVGKVKAVPQITFGLGYSF